ncbi:transmembrane protein [Cystoisospora suis]|uniref:Transmembrane protein n=1 Tax=Cystoisospora suis TaxID=483139 RepID=A0A2C6LA34_9APIC|nr:transmembrane protein [Cystoisospora suis]
MEGLIWCRYVRLSRYPRRMLVLVLFPLHCSLLQSTANKVEAKYGIFFVKPVPGWSTWWVPFQSTVCTIAQNATNVEAYSWQEAYKIAYGQINAADFCSDMFRLALVATTACFGVIGVGIALVIIITVSKMNGDPEFNSHGYFAHAKFAMIFVSCCLGAIVVAISSFMLLFSSSDFGGVVDLRVREGGLLTLCMTITLGLVIFAYKRDRALLSTKFEFEQLEWRAVDDPKEAYRAHMRYNMERLEAAKFGGLQSPQEMARQGE